MPCSVSSHESDHLGQHYCPEVVCPGISEQQQQQQHKPFLPTFMQIFFLAGPLTDLPGIAVLGGGGLQGAATHRRSGVHKEKRALQNDVGRGYQQLFILRMLRTHMPFVEPL